MKKKIIIVLSVIVAIILAVTLAGTIPVATKRLYCPHPEQTRYSILLGETQFYNMAESGPYEPDNGYERQNGVCWGDLSLYLI